MPNRVYLRSYNGDEQRKEIVSLVDGREIINPALLKIKTRYLFVIEEVDGIKSTRDEYRYLLSDYKKPLRVMYETLPDEIKAIKDVDTFVNTEARTLELYNEDLCLYQISFLKQKTDKGNMIYAFFEPTIIKISIKQGMNIPQYIPIKKDRNSSGDNSYLATQQFMDDMISKHYCMAKRLYDGSEDFKTFVTNLVNDVIKEKNLVNKGKKKPLSDFKFHHYNFCLTYYKDRDKDCSEEFFKIFNDWLNN